MERVYEATQIRLLQKMTLPALQLLIAHSFIPKRSSSARNCKVDRGCLWRAFVLTLVRFLFLDVSSCHCEHQMKCHFLLRLDVPVLYDEWNSFLYSAAKLCVTPFRVSMCECSIENKRHAHTAGLWSRIAHENVVLRLYLTDCGSYCHLSVALKPMSFKLVILVCSGILSIKLHYPTNCAINLGLSFGSVNCPELRTTNWFLVLIIRVKYVYTKRA